MKTALLLIYIIASTGAAVFFYFSGSRNSCSAQHLTSTDTAYIPYAIHDTLKVRIYRTGQKEKSRAVRNQAADSGQTGFSYSASPEKEGYNFIARADTSYNDSLLSLRLGFLSPSPLHPDSRFIIGITYRKTQVTRQIVSYQPVIRNDRFSFSLNIGLGFGLLHRQADIFAGAGISYSF